MNKGLYATKNTETENYITICHHFSGRKRWKYEIYAQGKERSAVKKWIKMVQLNLKGPYTNGKSTPHHRPIGENGVPGLLCQHMWQEYTKGVCRLQCLGGHRGKHHNGMSKGCIMGILKKDDVVSIETQYIQQLLVIWCLLDDLLQGCKPTLLGMSSSVSSQMRYFFIDWYTLQCSFIIR